MKSAVTLSLVPQAKAGPFVFHDDLSKGCQRAAALGFHAVEIFAPSAGAIDRSELRALLDSHRLSVAAVGTGAGWLVHKLSLTHPEGSVRRQAVEFIRDMIELAAEFKAPAIIGSLQGRWEGAVSREQALAWLAEAIVGLGKVAGAGEQVLLYEPLNRYETNLFNRVGDAAAFLQSIGASNVKVLADLFHMNIEESSIPDALRGASRFIGHVHFADSNRQAIGLGHTSMKPIIHALREIGYEGYLSAEIFPLPDSETAARTTIEAFRQYTV
jgi:sugar phosphate isomerase/epimerase